MRSCLREQLRRQKSRPQATGLMAWSFGHHKIKIPWTVGQRKWINKETNIALNNLMKQRLHFAIDSSRTMIVSPFFYNMLKEEINGRE